MSHTEDVVERLHYVLRELSEERPRDRRETEQLLLSVIGPMLPPKHSLNPEKYLNDVSWRLNRIENSLEKVLSRPQLHCRFSGPAGNDILELMTGVGPPERARAISHIRGGLSGTKHLTICDPYFFKGLPGSTPEEYASDFLKAVPTSTQTIELFVKPGALDARIGEAIRSALASRNIYASRYKTKELHDRVWISDAQKAYVVGASFNGLGNKCAFILELPDADRTHFLAELANVRSRAGHAVAV